MKCGHKFGEEVCFGELIYCDADEPYSAEHYICNICDSTYNIPERLKPAYAFSYSEFCSLMDRHHISDDNPELKNSAFIEVMGEQELIYMPMYFKKDHPNVLRLYFDDIDEPLDVKYFDGRDGGHLEPMTEEQGKQIVDFVKANEHRGSFLVHCAAGISRSGAIAKWITEYFGGDEAYYKQMNLYTVPNQRILNILRDVDSRTKRGSTEEGSN